MVTIAGCNTRKIKCTVVDDDDDVIHYRFSIFHNFQHMHHGLGHVVVREYYTKKRTSQNCKQN